MLSLLSITVLTGTSLVAQKFYWDKRRTENELYITKLAYAGKTSSGKFRTTRKTK